MRNKRHRSSTGTVKCLYSSLRRSDNRSRTCTVIGTKSSRKSQGEAFICESLIFQLVAFWTEDRSGKFQHFNPLFELGFLHDC